MTEKNTYCKKCGGLINNKTKKCTGCGRQYFHLPKINLLWVALTILVVALVGLNVYQYLEAQKQATLYAAVVSANEYSEKVVSSYRSAYDSLSSTNEENRKELYFWENSAVICTTEGSKYHHYGCSHIEGRSIYIYNIENAKAMGYTPCLDCCG